MAEVLGLAASIAGLITITAQITDVSYKYFTGVKQAPQEISELLNELNLLNKILTALRIIADKNPHSIVLRKLIEKPKGSDVEPLEGCLNALKSLKSTLEKPEGGRIKRIFHRLRWPLKKADTQEYKNRIETQRSLFTTALSIDHLSLATETNVTVGNTEVAVQNLQAEAEVEKTTRYAEKRKEKRDSVLRWLHPDDTDTKHMQITSKRHKNTGGWIFETPEFREFEKPSDLVPKSRLLWGYGIPGAGKSFLSSLVIDHFLDRAAAKNYGVAYVYFDFKEREKQTPIYTLASLVKQLGSQIGNLSAELEKVHDQCKAPQGRKKPTFEELYTVLTTMFGSFDQVFLIFDALDECDQRGQRTGLLKLFHCMEKDKANVFVTSRQHPGDIRESFLEAPKIELSAQKEDIATYIRQTIDGEPQAKRLIEQAKCQEQIISDLTECANGMFLLVRFHIEYLCQQTTGRQIRAALERLKTSSTEERPLDDTYNRAMEIIRKQPVVRANLGIAVLEWLVKAKRPLTVDELRMAVSIEPDRYELDELEFLVDMATLLDVCAGLTMFDKDSNTVRLVHYTVEEYVLKNVITPSTEFTLARACMTFISFDAFAQGPCEDIDTLRARFKPYPFLYYAVPYLDHHLTVCDQTLTTDMVFKFLKSLGAISSYSQAYSYYKSLKYDHSYVSAYSKDRSPLHLASAIGHLLILQKLLEGGTDILARDDRGQTALHDAAMYGKDAAAKLLIENGADLSAKDGSGFTALHTAIRYERDTMAKLLIENRADLSAKGKDEFIALNMAIMWSNDTIVKLLIENGTDLSAKDGSGFTALHTAIRYERDTMAKLLIENGADLSAKGEGEFMALNMAIMWSNDTIVKLLIENGADLSAKDRSGSTALHTAIKWSNDTMVKLLIENGADLSAKDGSGLTVLHTAIICRKDTMAKLLIENGADLSAKDGSGRTALHTAITRSDCTIVKLLIENGADLSDPDGEGHTPLVLATMSGNEKVSRIIQAALDEQAAARITIKSSKE